ncbi:MAG: hypothetical protein IPM42_21080 [Saprospiraceae bacterium]|nr:hypothetical protein [Saprospiraceae bacterium]
MLKLSKFKNVEINQPSNITGGRPHVVYMDHATYIFSNGEDITTFVDGVKWGTDNP